jgi:hypothetical protein
MDWMTPDGDYINEGTTAVDWMMPGGEYVMEAGEEVINTTQFMHHYKTMANG